MAGFKRGGARRTCPLWGKADIAVAAQMSAYDPKRTSVRAAASSAASHNAHKAHDWIWVGSTASSKCGSKYAIAAKPFK
jgi:hypothetical protein